MRVDAAYCYRRSGVKWTACVRVCVCVQVLVTAVSPAKMDESIEMSFGPADTRGPIDGGHTDATWRIRWINFSGGSDAITVKR